MNQSENDQNEVADEAYVYAIEQLMKGRKPGEIRKSFIDPATSPQTPETMTATIYEALGLPRTTAWHDAAQRPHYIYHADPIGGLTS